MSLMMIFFACPMRHPGHPMSVPGVEYLDLLFWHTFSVDQSISLGPSLRFRQPVLAFLFVAPNFWAPLFVLGLYFTTGSVPSIKVVRRTTILSS